MDSARLNNFPLIEFSKLELDTGSAEYNSVKSQVRKALEDFGCFEALFKTFPVDSPEAVANALEELFELPLETKRLNTSNKPLHGYVGQWPEVPLYESIGFDNPTVLEMVENVTNVFWPEGKPSFSKTIQSLSEKLSKVDRMVRRMVAESFGFEKYLDDLNNTKNYLLRVIKYEGPRTSEKMLGLMAHVDKSFVTVLYQIQVDGFEIETKDGEWITATPSPNSFLVLIGEALQTWVSGRLHAPNHRVMMSGSRRRYSAALFAVVKTGCVVKAPEDH